MTEVELAKADVRTTLPNAPAAESTQITDWHPPVEWTDGWRNLVLDLVDPDRKLTPLETAYFFARAQKLGLDPLARQIFPVKLNGRMEPFVGIHGIRMLAERTGERGSESVTGKSAVEGQESVTVTVERVRNGAISRYPFTAKAKEFAQPKPTDPARLAAWERSSWATKPEVMLTKCAAANAYRMAFPEVLGGLYIPEETGNELAEMEK